MIYPDPGTRLRRMQIWSPLIQEVAALTGENRERLMALVWRESWCGFAPPYSPKGSPIGWGDRNYGFGLCQIDRRYHSDFIKRELGRYYYAEKFGEPYTPREQFLYATSLLREAREWFKRSAANLRGDALERAVYASYNGGIARVYKVIKNSQDVDAATTGGDYSKYVLGLATVLQRPANQWIWAGPTT